MREVNKPQISLRLCALVALCLYAFAPVSFAQDKIIAIINNDIVTQKDLDDFVNFMRMQMNAEYGASRAESKIESMKKELLDKLIEDKVILQEAKKANIKIDDNRIKGKIEEARRRYRSDIEFQEALKRQGLVQADLETKIREQMMMYAIIDSKVRSSIVTSPSEVTDYYQKHSEEFKSPKIWELSACIGEGQEVISKIWQGLKKGRTLEELANENQLTVNKITMKQGQLKKELEDSIVGLKERDFTETLKIEDKYYVFRLDSITLPKQESLAEAQDSIYTFLYNKKMQENLSKWLDGLKKQTYIKIIQN